MSRKRTVAVLAVVALAALAGCSAARDSGASNAKQGAPGGGGQAVRVPRGSEGPEGFAPETDPRTDPESTFAVDVDTASYTYARSLINKGQRPSRDTIRPEEFINAFRQDYPQPAGDGFKLELDGARLPKSHGGASEGDLRLLRVGLQTRAEESAERRDAALTFVIDVSGSMADPGKLDMVQQALRTLVDQLRAGDSVAIVTFNQQAKVLREMTPVSQKVALRAAIDDLSAGGTTNLEAGLVAGYRVARQGFVAGRTNRVILLSDGLANQGNTAAEPILNRVREEADKQITLLGVGVGQDYGDALMEQLADRGDGFVVYVSDLDEARKVFVTQLPATLSVRAMDAKVQVTFNANAVARYRLIGYDDRKLSDSSFRNDHVDGGEVGAGHSVTALYAVRLRPEATGEVAAVHVRWQDPKSRDANETENSIGVNDLAVDLTEASARLQCDYAAAYFAEALRGSPYGDQVQMADLAAIAERAAARTDDSDVAELAAVIRKARSLIG